jgi:hypothetical protein
MNRIVKNVLAGVAVTAAIGAGAAYADRSGMAHGSFGGGPGMRFERFCAIDQGYISGRIADRLADRLKLTDPQKASLTDLRDTFVKAATDAKAVCGEKPDTSTVVGRLASTEKRAEATLGLIKAVQPKVEAFYATLDDTQKATFDRMGSRGRFMHPHWDQGGDRDRPQPG